MCDTFIPVVILLVRKNVLYFGRGLYVGSGRIRWEPAVAQEQLNVLDEEGVVVGGGAGVFAGSEKEIEGHTDHVRNGLWGRCWVYVVSNVEAMLDDSDGERLDSSWRRVRLRVGS